MFFINQIDFSILNFIAAHFHYTWLDTLMPLVTALGDNGIIWILLSAAFLVMPRYRKVGIAIILALLLGFIICNLGLKPLAARLRPFEFNEAIHLLIKAPLDYSFPSGHTEASFAAVTVLFLYQVRGWFAAMLLAFAIAFSRLYLYVHYPTDVFAGAIIGICMGILSLYIMKRVMVKEFVANTEMKLDQNKSNM
jgi:undecaprenyl-diphosphatase